MGKKKNKDKVDKFTDRYIASGFNASEAMRSISNAGKKAITVMATRYMSDEQVREIIKKKLERFKSDDVSSELVLSGLLEIALDSKIKASDKNRAYELLGKYLSMFKDREININANIINEDVLDKIKALRVPLSTESVIDNKP